MGRFCQYLPVQIVLTERNKSNYRFPSIVKNNGKEGLDLSKVRGEKWSAQFFRKDLIERERERERELEKTRMKRMKITLSASPSLIFFTQSLQYQIWKSNKYSILAKGNRTWTANVEYSTRISKFYDPTDSEYKFHKTRIKNWLSIGFEVGNWLRIYCCNQHIMFNIQFDGKS